MESEIYLLDIRKLGKWQKNQEKSKNFGILTTLLLKWHNCDVKIPWKISLALELDKQNPTLIFNIWI